MNRLVSSPNVGLLVALNAAICCACGPNSGSPTEGLSSTDGSVSGSSGNQSTGATGASGSGTGAGSSAGLVAVAVDGGVGGLPDAGAAPSVGDASSRNADGEAGLQDAGKDARAGGADASGNPETGPANGCNLPAFVSFQKGVQPFLITSCNGSGCHVIDAASTVAAGGYDHAYDWITAGAHASSCPETPTPLRFQVVIAVINAANPLSCSKSEKMPPPNAPDAATWPPLTACQIATLQAWLDEPLVTQMHRADDSSPTIPYPMPPFN